MANAFSPWHLLLILAVILLLFGAAKLPALAKSVGQSARVFKGEMKAMKDDDTVAGKAESTAAPSDPAAPSGPIEPPADASGAPDPRP